MPGRRLGQRLVGLDGVVFALAHDAPGPLVEFAAAQRVADDRQQARVRVGRFDDAAFELTQNVLHHCLLAAPPRCQRRQGQRFAQQVPRQGGQKAQQRAGLQKARAGRVGHQHVASTNHLQQPRHAQRGVRAQLQRIEEFIVQPLEQAVNRLQTAQGFEVKPVAAHHQVAAFDQRQAQKTRQIGVFKIGFVVRAGREQHDAAVALAGRHRAHGFEAGC